MNRTFWPETAGGPPIARKLGVRYAYGDGPEQTIETPAVRDIYRRESEAHAHTCRE